MSKTHKKGEKEEEYANLGDKEASASWFDRFFNKDKKGDKQSFLTNEDRKASTQKPAVEAAPPPKAAKPATSKKGDKRALLDDSDSDHGESRSPRHR